MNKTTAKAMQRKCDAVAKIKALNQATGRKWFENEELARMMGINFVAVRTFLSELKQMGWIDVVERVRLRSAQGFDSQKSRYGLTTRGENCEF
jgi:hypothetical protein